MSTRPVLTGYGVGPDSSLVEVEQFMNQEAIKRIQRVRDERRTDLDLRGLALESLPVILIQCSALSVLRLDNNQLTFLPDGLGALKNLKVLSLRGNKLRTIPASLESLQQLSEFDLSENEIEDYPDPIDRLVSLTVLSLRGNGLASVPESIGALERLRILNLAKNRLGTLPAALGRLAALEKLNLSGNQLTALPSELRSLDRLAALFLHGNPGLGLPDENLGPQDGQAETALSPQLILDEYFRLPKIGVPRGRRDQSGRSRPVRGGKDRARRATRPLPVRWNGGQD